MMQKIRFNIKYFYFIFYVVSLITPLVSAGQELKVLQSIKEYRQLVEKDSLQMMVELKTAIPSLVYDLHYATKNNFTGRKLYGKGDRTFARIALVNALKKVQSELMEAGYGLKIWDAYRPYEVTKKMWDLIGDERYVANPSRGSNHNRGLAVDITLIDSKTGIELPMGTGYDNFTDTAHHSFTNLPANILQNRLKLKSTMERHGFKSFETEWWHYSFPNDRGYDVLDLPFKKLGK